MRCRCDTPMVFAGEPETCQRCGRSTGYMVPTTKEIVTAIVEIAHGRTAGSSRGRPPSSAP